MKEKFEEPVVEIINFPIEDVVTCSEHKPGHGWGDDNHTHKHWKDCEYDDT